jgi:hypothetical protein
MPTGLAMLKQGDLIFLSLTTGNLRDGVTTEGSIGGELQLAVAEISEQEIQVQLGRLGLYSTSVATWRDAQGELGLTSQMGGGSITLSDSTLTLSFDADLTFAELTERQGYQNLEVLKNGSRVPRKRKFKGILSGLIGPGDAERSWQLQNATLRLREFTEGVQAEAGLEHEAAVEIGVEMAAEGNSAPPTPCPGFRIGSGGTVKIRPILFRDEDENPPQTGASFAVQLQNAAAVWGRCCLRFAPVAPLFVSDTVALHAVDRHQIVGAVAPHDLIGDMVSVFFIEGLAPGDGGGTLEGNTILLNEAMANQNPFLLAHELGHLMGLLPDVTVPDIMNAFTPPPQPNPLSNCFSVTRFNKIVSGFDCCFDL